MFMCSVRGILVSRKAVTLQTIREKVNAMDGLKRAMAEDLTGERAKEHMAHLLSSVDKAFKARFILHAPPHEEVS
jgi:hypothetical protein